MRAVPAIAAGGETKVVHRIAVFESHGEITNVISQMDVMRSVGGEGRVGGGQVLGWWWGGWRGGWGAGAAGFECRGLAGPRLAWLLVNPLALGISKVSPLTNNAQRCTSDPLHTLVELAHVDDLGGVAAKTPEELGTYRPIQGLPNKTQNSATHTGSCWRTWTTWAGWRASRWRSWA